MANVKKDLKKQIDLLIEDVLDNYNKYDLIDKNRVSDLVLHIMEVNKHLEKYDKKKSQLRLKFETAFKNFFGV